jgi:hypothetical protein
MTLSECPIRRFVAKLLQNPLSRFDSDPGNSMGIPGPKHRSSWKAGITNSRMAGGSSRWEKGEKTAKRLAAELIPESHVQAFTINSVSG